MKKLPKLIKNKKRHGRGYGSGRGGHTSGRGMKGQKSRSSVGLLFEGVKVRKSTIKRLPLRRGKDKFKASPKPIAINLSVLNILPANTKVTLDTLIKHGIVDERDAKKYGVKVLGGGDLQKKLIIEVPCSKSALEKTQKNETTSKKKETEKTKKVAKNK